MYRIKYWYQEDCEPGRWCLTGTMSLSEARNNIKLRSLNKHDYKPEIVKEEASK